MNIDDHERFRRMTDESLAGGIADDGERLLREHLDTCTGCREYHDASNRVVAGLRGFSFEADASLNARLLSSLRRSAQRGRRRWVWSSAAAVVLTVGGTLVDLRFGDLMASVFDIQRMQVREGLLTFWIVPSLCVLMLFPLLPLLGKAGTRREERI